MRRILMAALMVLFAGSVFAAKGEFNDECAYGLALGKHVMTKCSVTEMIDGKTYCFSSEGAKKKFMADPAGNLAKAEKTYGRS
ncbi:MAG: hypothetical protein GC151_01765 [Betaproteobacteria bacterium]|nr:hypothetical protein [Betaproteobacteria bacterium]